MAGASDQTQRVSFVSANWTASDDGSDGHFGVQIVTEDGARRAVKVTAADMPSIIALTQASDVLLWDPKDGTLIAANLAGDWISPSWSAGDARLQGRPHGRP